MQISQGAARSPVISREQRELARSTLRPALRLIPVLNMHKLYWPSEKQNGSVHAPENRMNITTNSEIFTLTLFHLRQYFNGKKIRRILKLYGLFVHNMIFFLLQTGVCRDFFRHVIAEIPDGKKLVTSAFLTRMRLHNRARAHGYVCA